MPFDVGKPPLVIAEWSAGKASYSPFRFIVVGDQAIPQKILFRSHGDAQPRLTMGIEVVDGAPECTYLALDADDGTPVRDKHLKPIRVEKLITEIVATCAHPVERTSETGHSVAHGGPATAGQVKAVEQLQRRRRDPNDRAVLEQVAALYKSNPDAPVAAISEALNMSARTAARWAARCSEVGLLPQVSKKGQKRL